MLRALSIFPTDPRSRTTDRLLRFCVYEIVEARLPPKIDLRRTLKHSLLSPWLIAVITRWQRRYMMVAGVMFCLAQIASCGVLAADVPHGRAISLVSCGLQLPLLVLSFAALCTDIILELAKTFEFWFFTFANTATTVVMGLYLGDARAVVLFATWLGVEYNICIDAALHGFSLMVIALVVAVLCQIFMLTLITFELIPEVHNFKLVNYGTKAVTSDAFLLNTISIVLYMLGRSLFRRVVMLRLHHKQSKDDPTVSHGIRLVRCVSYRCAVKLRPLTLAIAVPDVAKRTPLPQGPLRFVDLEQTFDSRETFLCGRNLSLIRIPRWLQILFHAIGGLGLSLTGISFLVLNYVRPYPSFARVGAIASPVFTVLYCFVIVSLYHPGLLKQLCYSVDFAYMLAQFLFAHVCAAYLFEWDDRTYILAASFCWVSVMLTVDAFTPAARDRIGFRLIFIVPLLLLSITAHVLITIEVTRTTSAWGLRNSSMFQFTVIGHALQLHVKPAFFNRVWMLVFWELRALWRILKASRHDLVMIHGAVDLDVSMRRRGGVAPGSTVGRSRRSIARIQPATSSQSSVGRCDETQTAIPESTGHKVTSNK